MIGKVYTSTFPYYDRTSKSLQFKNRPCLVIGQADSGDYIVLPISSVTDKNRIDPHFDIPLSQSVFRFLKKDCYLRTHKQTTINIRNFGFEIGDLKKITRMPIWKHWKNRRISEGNVESGIIKIRTQVSRHADRGDAI